MMTVWTKIRSALCAFAFARAGNVAITFAFATLPIMAFIGGAVDYSRANSVKADLQGALDSAALMLAKEATTDTSDQLQAHALAYVTANYNRPGTTISSVSASYTTGGGSQVTVSGSANVPTDFMKILGVSSVTVNGSSTVKWGSTRLRVALVLDNTGSMADDGKMTALKAATASLLTQLQSAAENPGDVYVSIIPFSKDVNVGSSYYNADWIDWTDWNSANGSNQSTTTCSNNSNNGNAYGYGNGNGYGNSYGYGYSYGNGYGNSGSNCKTTTQWVAADHSTWNGCITDRGSPTPIPDGSTDYDQSAIAPDPSVSASLFPAEQYSSCPVALMGLSYDWTAMTDLVTSMQPNGNTNQPIGLVWGWQSLVGGGPFTVPAMDSNYTYQQAIILLSDGLNTQDRWSSSQTQVDYRMYDKSGNGTCANIKAAGITIYTIQVNTGHDPTSTLLQNCASSSDKFFLVTSASGIADVFNDIGTNLTKLRVAK